MENLNQSLSGNTDVLLNDLEAMNQQFEAVLLTTIELITDLTNLTKDSLYEVKDISYENLDNLTSGKILSSYNCGRIDGDVNIGGIAGSISLDIGIDPDDNLTSKIFGREKETRRGIAVIEDCTNEGDVTAKKDGVGGIAGCMDFGFITDSLSNAKIESVEGDYVGGIAGDSVAKIANSYGKNILIGRSYIGGIAGRGKNISNSYAMANINASKGFIGGIAGVEADDSEIVENYFVSDELGGIDGISYASIAEPITYNDLLKVKDIPDIFKTMNTIFFANDKKVTSVKTSFHGNVDENDIPIVPDGDGKFGYWDSFATTDIVMDQRVEAIYEPDITTIGSNEMEGDLHTILVDGIFTNEESIEVTTLENTEKKVVASYKVTLNNKDMSIDAVRYYINDKCKKIEVYENETWNKVAFKKDGLYAVFETDKTKNEITFRILK